MPYRDEASILRLPVRAAHSHRPPPAVTVVVPTRNEAGNVVELVDRLEQALAGLAAEIVFVDDSDDDTPDVVLRVATASRLQVHLLHRDGLQRRGGLGGAVVAGLRMAKAPWVVVMDVDLQHPPALVPALVARGITQDVDLVVGSRYCTGGDRVGLATGWRRAASTSATAAARSLFSRQLQGVSDPMTGFFAVRRDSLDLSEVRPQGFKILLELLVRSGGGRVSEVPFTFGARHAGRSKASAREGFRFFALLMRLKCESVASGPRHLSRAGQSPDRLRVVA